MTTRSTTIGIFLCAALLTHCGFSASTDDDVEIVNARLRTALGSAKRGAETIREWLDGQSEDGSWPDIVYVDTSRSSWKPLSHLDRCRDIAHAYDTKGHEFYHDPRAATVLRRGVEHWYEKKYRCKNWWFNDMAVPPRINAIMIFASEVFEAAPVRADMLIYPREIWNNLTGGNGLDWSNIVFVRSIVTGNVANADKAVERILGMINIGPNSGENICCDYSFHSHGQQLYNGGYGNVFWSNVIRFATMWKDTRWALKPEPLAIMRAFLLEGEQWMMWQGALDMLPCGRQLGPNCLYSQCGQKLRAARFLIKNDPLHKSMYHALLERNVNGGRNDLVGNRYFYCSNYMVHRRPDFFAGIRTCSRRIVPMEDQVNGDLTLGRYLADGVMLVYRDPEKYNNLTATWDWTRLPGSSLPATPRHVHPASPKNAVHPRLTHSLRTRYKGESTFAGGVTDGRNGISVYRQNLDGVKACKGYFFDNDAIVCLGAGIDSTSAFSVATTVENCNDMGEYKQGEDRVWCNRYGYIGKHLKTSRPERKGGWWHQWGRRTDADTRTYLYITIEHGLKPQGARYQYTVLPNASWAQTQAYKGAKVLSNTPSLQAIEFSDGTLTAIVYAPCALGAFVAETPGLYMIGQDQICVADPSEALDEIAFRYRDNSYRVALPQGNQRGMTIKLALR